MSDETLSSYHALLGKRVSAEEYVIDFFGGLVPGVLFVVATTLAVLPPILAIAGVLDPNRSKATGEVFLRILSQTSSAVWVSLFILFLLVAYVLGHLYSRYDIKKANQASFRTVRERLIAKHREKLGTQAGDVLNDIERKHLRQELGCAEESECEFPYPYYRSYLKKRDMHYLLELAIWGPTFEDGESDELESATGKRELMPRTKNLINVLKMRLRHHCPERCGTIIRNESHVRLASSTWYVSEWLLSIGAAGVLACAIALLLGNWLNSASNEALAADFVLRVLSPLSVFVVAYCARRAIQGFLHYQRLREVFFVLETAYVVFRHTPHLLSPPFELSRLESYAAVNASLTGSAPDSVVELAAASTNPSTL